MKFSILSVLTLAVLASATHAFACPIGQADGHRDAVKPALTVDKPKVNTEPQTGTNVSGDGQQSEQPKAKQ